MIFRPYGPAYERTQADKLAYRTRTSPRGVPRNYFADAPVCAPTSSPVVGTSGVGVCTAGGGERSPAAGNQFQGGTHMEAGSTERAIDGDAREGNGSNQNNSTAGGVKTSGTSCPNCNDALRLNAARVIFGRAQG